MTEVLYYAIPFFVLLLVVEALTYRHLRSDGLVGYELRDTRTSIAMGLGNVAVNAIWKLAVVAIYAALYELTPLRLDPARLVGLGRCCSSATTSPTTGSTASSHESRVFWASHVVHHSSQHYNLSTAVRQTWVPMTYLPFWLPLLLLGFAPWMVLLAQSWSLIYQFGLHTERIGRCRGRSRRSSTRRRTTACTTARTSSTWTATTAASSSSGTGCSAPSSRRASASATG